MSKPTDFCSLSCFCPSFPSDENGRNPLRELYDEYLHLVSYGPFERKFGADKGYEYSDTVLHLPVLEYYASLCHHITEFGSRECNTTLAFLAGLGPLGELHSYDLDRTGVSAVVSQKKDQYRTPKWYRYQMDTGNPDTMISDTDFLFIDTAHIHQHVWNELRLHGRRARKFIGFHDTYSCAIKDTSGPDPNARGIETIIEYWLDGHPGEYQTVYRTKHNNGLWILERIVPKYRVLPMPELKTWLNCP